MTISAQIIEVLDALCAKFGIAVDWTQENILPYLQTLAEKCISYEIATSIAWLVLAAILIAIGIVLIIINWDKSDFDTCLGALVLGCLVIIPGTLVAMAQIYDILACIYFPEKEILETAHLLYRKFSA